MKKTLILTVLALFAFASCKGDKTTETEKEETKVETQVPEGTVQAEGGAVAFVRMEVLIDQYSYAVEKLGDFEQEYEKAQKALESEARSWERDASSYQEKAQKGLMMRSEMAQTEEQLQRRGQNLQVKEQQQGVEFSEKYQVIMNNISHNLDEYLKEYNKDYKFSVILTTGQGGPVLHANPAYDITATVVKALNEQYAGGKSLTAPVQESTEQQ